jgi:hypothetical protein
VPRKRKFEKARLDHMSLAMESHLRSGSYLFPGEDKFLDEGHRREMWLRHRDKILAKEPLGKRPQAFWQYERPWPAGSESEEDAIYKLEDTTDREQAEIEADWTHSLRVALQFAKTEAEARDKAAGLYGVPSWFFTQHAPRVRAEIEAERQAWAAGRSKVIQLETRG